MKYCLIIFVILSCSNSLYGQDVSKQFIDKNSFNRYEENKKEKATALVWYSIIPGAGLWYAESGHATRNGIIFFGSELFIAYEYFKSKEDLYLIGLIALRVVEIGATLASVDDYNRALRRELRMQVSCNYNQGISCKMKLIF